MPRNENRGNAKNGEVQKDAGQTMDNKTRRIIINVCDKVRRRISSSCSLNTRALLTTGMCSDNILGLGPSSEIAASRRAEERNWTHVCGRTFYSKTSDFLLLISNVAHYNEYGRK